MLDLFSDWRGRLGIMPFDNGPDKVIRKQMNMAAKQGSAMPSGQPGQHGRIADYNRVIRHEGLTTTVSNPTGRQKISRGGFNYARP